MASPAFLAIAAPPAAVASPPRPSLRRATSATARSSRRHYCALAAAAFAVPRGKAKKIRRRAAEPQTEPSVQDAATDANPVALALRTRLAELAKTGLGADAARRWEELGNAKVLVPETTLPWGVLHFTGGAVLGQFPELCYTSLLQPLADKAGLAVICTPYELSRDHQELADAAGADFSEALALGAAKFGWAPERMPRFAMGHSLGAKLQVLLRCQEGAQKVAGVALLAFNNFGVEDQVRLLREALKAVQGPSSFYGGPAADRIWKQFLEPAIGRAATLTGVQFTPGPDELLDLVEERYDREQRTRLFRFGDDTLDCSEELLKSLVVRGARSADSLEMKGGHLTPVVVSLADVGAAAAAGAPPDLASRLGERLGGAAAPKFGSEGELEVLVQADRKSVV